MLSLFNLLNYYKSVKFGNSRPQKSQPINIFSHNEFPNSDKAAILAHQPLMQNQQFTTAQIKKLS